MTTQKRTIVKIHKLINSHILKYVYAPGHQARNIDINARFGFEN